MTSNASERALVQIGSQGSTFFVHLCEAFAVFAVISTFTASTQSIRKAPQRNLNQRLVTIKTLAGHGAVNFAVVSLSLPTHSVSLASESDDD